MKHLRLAAGYSTQEALAEAMNMDRSSVAKWESGAAYPRFETLNRLSRLLKCSVDELVVSLQKAKDDHTA